MRTCNVCDIQKPLSDFYKNKHNPLGHTYQCKLCIKEYNERRRQLESVKTLYRGYNLRKFGLTSKQYDELLLKQKGLCKICQEICPTGKRLAVDHDHDTGRVRGLLCLNCNRGLGNFKDKIGNLYRAIAYLEDSKDNG